MRTEPGSSGKEVLVQGRAQCHDSRLHMPPAIMRTLSDEARNAAIQYPSR